MSKRIVFMSIAMAASVPFIAQAAHADQAAWISKRDADAGAALVGVGQELRGYCAPCGDKAYVARSVSSVTVAATADSHWEVRVNGRGVDLAYEYVLVAGRWKNLATLVGVPVSGVPVELPASLPRK